MNTDSTKSAFYQDRLRTIQEKECIRRANLCFPKLDSDFSPSIANFFVTFDSESYSIKKDILYLIHIL